MLPEKVDSFILVLDEIERVIWSATDDDLLPVVVERFDANLLIEASLF